MQKLSLNSLKKKLKRYPHLNSIQSFIDKVLNDGIKFLLLYGSLAKGNYTQYSDIDILCVFDADFEDQKERFMAAYRHSDGIIQPKSLSYKEFKKGLLDGNPFLHSIIENGIILYSGISEENLKNWIKEGKKKLKIKFLPPD
ncbi:MAG: nucleotidyltransferase domain-containing protein [Promethearchaeota archaeon]|nr:MAG: nucleotidyltransferase domain-containing protein [Candidatus Lokiarchaeota archaeon]